MASVSWTATTGGLWSTGSNWSTGEAPQRGDDVSIDTNSQTVTYTTGSLILDSLSMTTTLLDFTGGTLTAQNGYSLNGGLALSAGTMRLVNGSYGGQIAGGLNLTGGTLTLAGGALASSLNSSSFVLASGATLNVNGGTFTDYESTGTLSGTVAGNGVMLFDYGLTNLNAGVALSVATTEINNNATVQLNSKLTDSHALQLGSNGTLSLNSQTLTLSGKGALYGQITNGGSLIESGTGVLNGLVLDNGSLLDITGTVNETGSIVLAQVGSGSLTVGSSGTLRITGNDAIENAGNGATMVNNGLIVKVGGSNGTGYAATISAQFTNTGTINAAVGTINFAGPSNSATQSVIGGTLLGNTIEFTQGYYTFSTPNVTTANLDFGGSSNVTLSTALTYANNWSQTGGLLLLDQNLTLSGDTTFDGGEMKGTATVTTSGPLHLGSSMDLEGNLTFDLNGPVVQSGGINLGLLSDSIDQATLSSTSTWALEGAASISGAYGTITDLGDFVKLNGAQNSVVTSVFQEAATGTIAVDTGTLSLTGNGTLSGAVTGAAVLDVSGDFSLSSGVSLTVGEFILDGAAQLQVAAGAALSYGKDWASEGGTLVLNNSTVSLTGTTALAAGAISGTGTVTVNGPVFIGTSGLFQVAQGADLIIKGSTAEQEGNVLLTTGATAPTLTVAGGTTYIMDAGYYLGGNQNSPVGTVTIAKGGTLETNGAGAVTQIDATIVNSGTISLNYGEMQFVGPLEGSGAVDISNGATLDLNYSAAVTSAISFGNGGGDLYLEYPNDFTGTINNFATGDMIELNGFAFGASFTVNGDNVTISEANGQSMTLTFSTSQSAGSLMLGEGPHLGLALIHT